MREGREGWQGWPGAGKLKLEGRSDRVGFRPVFGEKDREQRLSANRGGWRN